MIFRCSSGELLQILKIAEGVIDKRSSIEGIAGLVLLDFRDNFFWIKGTDLFQGVIGKVSYESEGIFEVESGRSFCINCEEMIRVAKVFKDEGREMIWEVDENKLRIHDEEEKFEYLLSVVSGEEFPNLPVFKREESLGSITVEAKKFVEFLKSVVFAVSKEEAKFVLSGIYLEEVGGKRLRGVATDGHRLVWRDTDVMEIKLSKGILIPWRVVSRISLLCRETDEDDRLELEVFSKYVVIRKGEIEYFTYLIEGEYPDYKMVIPQEFSRKVKVKVLELKRGLKSVYVFRGEALRYFPVYFDFKSDDLIKEVELISTIQERGSARVRVIVDDYVGDKFRICLNYVYLMDFLNELKDDEVVEMRFIDEKSPVCIVGNEDYRYVVMPMVL